jgi:hypothetical protein
VQFGVEDLHITLLSNFEFRETMCSGSCSLLKNVDDILPRIFHSRKEAQSVSHNLTFYQFLFLATCFGFWESHHQAIKNVHEEK